MFHSIARALASAALIVISPLTANAVTVLTFDGVPGFIGDCGVVESGFTISNCPKFFTEPGTIHLDDGGSSFQNFVDFTAAKPFNANSVVIAGLGQSFFDSNTAIPYNNVIFEGFRDGVKVANQAFSTGLAVQTQTVNFDVGFLALELLRITQATPSPEELLRFPNAFCVNSPCGHINLNQISLTPVPLPAGLPLLVSALVLFGFVGWRSRPATG